MKRLSTITAIILLAASELFGAEMKAVNERVGFTFNEISAGAGFYDDGHQLRPVYTASYMLGRHFNERWSGGVSALCSLTSYYSGYKYYGERVYDYGFSLRILLNARYHIMAEKFSPYIGFDIGPAYLPGYSKSMLPFAGCQIGCRWLIKTHNVIGFYLEPGISLKGYRELQFRLTYEFQ